MIRDIIDEVKFEDRKEVVDKIFNENKFLKNYYPSNLNEALIEDIKNTILKLIQDITDSQILNDIMVRLYKEDFVEQIKKICEQKNVPKLAEPFSDIFFSTAGSLEDKKEYLDALDEDTPNFIFDESIFENSTKSLLSYAKLGSSFITNFIPKMAQWEPKELDKTGVGRGEAFLILHVNGGRKAEKGDVEINNLKIEVKATQTSGTGGARLMNHSYGNAKQYFSTFKSEIISKSRDISKVPRKDLAFNINKSNISNLNEFLPNNKEDTKIIFENMFKSLYPKNSVSTKWLDKVINDDGSLTRDFYTEFGIYQFKVYQDVEGFDGIWFLAIDGKKPKCRYTTANEIEKDIKNGAVKLNAGINWNDSKPVYQFALNK